MSKEINTNTNTAAEVTEKTTAEINNIFDAFASKLTGATTPVNLDVNIAVGVKGSVGDIQIALTSENYCTVTNGAHRREAQKAEAEATKREAKAKAEAEAKREAARLRERYTVEQIAEIINMIK